MEGYGGLIELILVFGFLLGLAFLELRSNRRYKKQKAAEEAAKTEPLPRSPLLC